MLITIRTVESFNSLLLSLVSKIEGMVKGKGHGRSIVIMWFKIRAIALNLVLAMHSLKMVEWGVIVGCDPTITPHF